MLIIVVAALVASYEAVDRLFHPQPVAYVGAVVAASLIGFFGNEELMV